MYLHKRHVVMSVVVCLVLVFSILLTAWPVLSSTPHYPPYQRRDRFGIAFVPQVQEGPNTWVPQSFADYSVAPLGVGWYSDWRFDARVQQPRDATLEYVQLLDVRRESWPPDWVAVQQAADVRHGSLWLIGNEPEGPINQGKRTPEDYADLYHLAYVLIKGWDPTARIAIGGVIQPSPLRLRWLERTMEAYQAKYGEPMPVDVWNIHVQILPEEPPAPGKPDGGGAGIPVGLEIPRDGVPVTYTVRDCANVHIFTGMIVDFRAWMKAHGQQNKPLIISEMGVLQPSEYLVEGGDAAQGDALIEHFMVETFNWLLTTRDPETGYPDDDYHLVQQWLWYSLNDKFYDHETGIGFNGSLYDYRTKALTRFGLKFVEFQNPQLIKRYWIPSIRR